MKTLRSIIIIGLLLQITVKSFAGTYTWTGGGDGVSLFQEANWNGIPVINPNTDLLHNLVINSGNVGGSGFSGNLHMGGNNLLITGGILKSSSSTGIKSFSSGSSLSTIDIQGGLIDVTYMVNQTITLSGAGQLTLTGGNNPLNNTTIDFDAAATGQIYCSNETVADFTSEHLSKITVGGSAAVINTNLSVVTSGSGCVVTVIATGGGSDYTWNGSVNNDGFNEGNWSNGTQDIPQIDVNVELSDNLIIDSGTPDFNGVLALGGHSLDITGGTVTVSSSNGIKSFTSGSVKSSMSMTGGSLSSQYLVNLALTMSGDAQLTLNGGDNPVNGTTIEIDPAFTGQIHFTNETPADVSSEHLGKMTVDGEAAIEGLNIALSAQGVGTILTVSFGNPWEFNHTDTDLDGVPDTVEINLGLDPNNAASSLGNRPNVIFILVDDMGFGDLGKFYQDSRTGSKKFDTPYLDTLADEGLMMTDHYISAPVCAPSRASLLEGLHQGHSSIRNNQFDKELPDELNLPTMMRNAGYHTAIVGKYGLAGGRTSGLDGHPIKRGFDEFFGYLFHVEGHEHYPRNGTTEKNANLHDGFSTISTGTDKVYTTDVWTARAKDYIIRRNTENAKQPFFLYLAYDVPHSKLQIPTQAYPAGYGVSGGVQWTGESGSPQYVNTNTGTIDSYYHPDYAGTSWTDNEKRHVGMIRRVDYAIKDIVETLRDLGIDDNTLIIFTSDNGPHNEGGQDPRSFGSYGNMDGIKRDMWEAGIRTPAIAWWPGSIPAGSTTALPMGAWDWMKTFADVAGMPLPAQADGESILPELTAPGTQGRETSLYFEYQYSGSTPTYSDFESSRRGQARNQMQAIRIGDFKGVRTNISAATDDFEIYNVVTDAKETTNLAASMTDLQQQMKDEVLRMRKPLGSASRPYDNETVPAVTADSLADGLNYSTYTGRFPWIPDFSTLTPTSTDTIDVVDLSVRPTGTNFGIHYSGYLDIPTTGSYTFYLQTDAAAHIMLHGIQMLNDDYKADHTERSYTVNLEAGLHPINIRYKHRDEGTYALNLSVSGPGISKQLIPATMYKRANNCFKQSIALNEGWNMISSFVRPEQLDMLTAFNGVSQDVIMIKDVVGSVAIPSLSINNIGDWDITQAYKVKASASTILEVTCTKIDPAATPVGVGIGWNMIAYLLDIPSDISTALSSISADLIIAKDASGNVYIPQFGINGIGNMLPGQGYQLKMSASASITYSSGSRTTAPVQYVRAAETQFFEIEVNTGNNATIIIPENVVSGLVAGDEIGVFNSMGYLAGAAVYEAAHTAITVWGTDPSASSSETYMEPGDQFIMKVWHHQTGNISEVDFEIAEGNTTYTTDGLTILGDFTANTVVTSDDPLTYSELNLSTYPNPNKGAFNALIKGYTGTVDLYLLDIFGRLLDERSVELSGESHLKSFDITGSVPGIYLLELVAGDRHEVIKISVSP